MSHPFIDLLLKKVKSSVFNNHRDNYDSYRFGKRRAKYAEIKQTVYSNLIGSYFPKHEAAKSLESAIKIIGNYGDRLCLVYDIFADEYSKNTFVDLVAFKILNSKRVKLPVNNDLYWKKLGELEGIKETGYAVDVEFSEWKLHKFNLKKMGIPVELLFRAPGILHDFVLEQYNYKNFIKADIGDVVIDAGGCWGDTALYFASKVGESGKVFSFEFIPGNIRVFNINLNMNEELRGRIELIPSPLWEHDGVPVFFTDEGPGSRVMFEKFDDADGTAETKSIDGYCAEKKIGRIDFIKMDIEGAEPFALRGAINTIRKQRPKLAIACYHSLDDFVNVPLWINDLGVGYELYLDHFTIHWEESIIFAKAKK